MYCFQVEIRDGKFVTQEGLTQTFQAGNWCCKIENSKLVCLLEQSQDKGILKYVILKNGLSRLTLEHKHKSKVLKSFWLSKPNHFKLNGILQLPTDAIRGVYPKFFVK